MAQPSKFGFEKLGDNNYANWRVQMKGLLATKDCLRAITEANDPGDAKAMGLMIMCVEEQHLATIEQAASAAAAWAALEALYRQTSTANLIQLRKQLTSLDKKANESIPQYVARAKSVADQIRAATGVEVNSTDLVLAVLAGLPSKYDMVRTVVENMEELPSLAQLQAKLLLVEKQLPESDGETAFYTKVDSPRRHGRLHNGGKFANQVNIHKDTECWFCKELGHVKRNCPKLKPSQIACSLLATDVGL
jgi:hypothetical protein